LGLGDTGLYGSNKINLRPTKLHCYITSPKQNEVTLSPEHVKEKGNTIYSIFPIILFAAYTCAFLGSFTTLT
jgi:hypothetical protein